MDFRNSPAERNASFEDNHLYNQHAVRGQFDHNGAQITQKSNNNNNQKNDSSDADREYFSIKSHGGKAAVEVAVDNTKENWNTIRLEAAAKQNGQSKAYNWHEKVSIQITKAELPIVIATLLGLLPMCEFKNHGGDANKWFYIENQRDKYFFRVGQASTKQALAAPVPVPEALMMGHTALMQYCKNFKGLSCDAALESIKTMSKHLLNAGKHRIQKKN